MPSVDYLHCKKCGKIFGVILEAKTHVPGFPMCHDCWNKEPSEVLNKETYELLKGWQEANREGPGER